MKTIVLAQLDLGKIVDQHIKGLKSDIDKTRLLDFPNLSDILNTLHDQLPHEIIIHKVRYIDILIREVTSKVKIAKRTIFDTTEFLKEQQKFNKVYKRWLHNFIAALNKYNLQNKFNKIDTKEIVKNLSELKSEKKL